MQELHLRDDVRILNSSVGKEWAQLSAHLGYSDFYVLGSMYVPFHLTMIHIYLILLMQVTILLAGKPLR